MTQYLLAIEALREIQRKTVDSAQCLEKLVESEPPPPNPIKQ